MNIILFADRLPPLIGGMETHAHYFAQYFKGKSRLTIISRLNDQDVLVDENYSFIKHIDIRDFLRQFQGKKTVLFFNSGRWIEHLRDIRRLLPKAIITYRTGGNEIIQSPLTIDMPDYKKRQEYWRNAINDTVDFLITNSSFTDNRLAAFGIKQSMLRHIAGGVAADEVVEAAAFRNATRKKYSITESDRVCVCCARFVPYKRTDFLLRALNKCEEPISLFLAGDGPLEEELKKLAKEQNYPIRFLGRLPQREALELIAASDVYVQASGDYKRQVQGGSYIHTEGMGRSLLEAVCSGVPVVVTKCGAVGEYINEENGVLVTTEDEMAQAVDKLLSEKKCDSGNSEKYINLYSFDRIFEEYISLWK